MCAKTKIQSDVADRLKGQSSKLMTAGFTFGIPATWGERAAERMEKAIADSKITDGATFSDLILEPEAAGLAEFPYLDLGVGAFAPLPALSRRSDPSPTVS